MAPSWRRRKQLPKDTYQEEKTHEGFQGMGIGLCGDDAKEDTIMHQRLTIMAALLACVSVASAVTIETVPVGDIGNVGELSGSGAVGGHGISRICGSVSYYYSIGKHEVTAGQYAEFLNKVGGVDTYGLYNTGMSSTSNGSGITRSGGGTLGDPYTYSVASAFVNRPVNFVSFWDSCRFANWLHNGQPTGPQDAGTTERGAYTLDGYRWSLGETIQRNANAKWAVTSEDEWYKAAYYKGGSTNAGYWDYPTRSNTAPGRDMADLSGNNANFDPLSTGQPIDSPQYTTLGGEFQNSASPYGTFDQGGNVWEWNEVVMMISGTPYRGMRGGAFNCWDNVLKASYRIMYSGNPMVEYHDLGFRVTYIPEPATFVLLALGGLALLRRRK